MKYSELTEVYEKLESTSKRLDKTWFISKLLEKTKEDDLNIITLLLQGRLYPTYDESKIGVASRLVLKAINIATGIPGDKIEEDWKKTGDLGITAENLIGRKKQATLFSTELTIKKIYDNLRSLSSLEGAGTVDRKVKLIAELLTSATPIEAKYIVRTVLEDLRVGVGEGSLRDAIVWAYFPKVIGVFFYCSKCKEYVPNTPKCLGCNEKLDVKSEQVTKGLKVLDAKGEIKDVKGYDVIRSDNPREAYNHIINLVQEALDITNDFAEVAGLAKKGISALAKVNLEALKPVKVMLYQKATGFENAFERVGTPAAIEYKYDGFRLQLHKKNNEIKLYTRRLEDVTLQFPDVVKLVEENIRAKEFILDSEVIGIDPKTQKWLPFQDISQRIKRKYDIQEIAKTVPIMVNLFDIVELEGKNVIKKPFKERRTMLETITHEVKDQLQLAEQIVTSDIEEAQKFYEKALKLGNEGVMVKSLESPYKPGSRVGYGVKIKPTMETLDLVIIGAEWGEGKRSKWLSSYTVACRDENGDLLEVGKVSTGLKEKAEEGLSFEELTKLLKPLMVSEKGKSVKVKPKIVIEVDYEEIQKSPTYSSGFALRFPRVVGLRRDKPVSEVSSLGLVEELYFGQK